MDVFDIDPQKVINPRELMVRVLPSPDANFLFIYTGVIGDLTHAGGYSQHGNLYHSRIILNLSDLHNRRFDGHPFRLAIVNGQVLAAPVASLGSIAASEGGIVFGVDAVAVDEDNQNLRLLVDIGVSGENASLHKVAYQVNVLVYGPQ